MLRVVSHDLAGQATVRYQREFTVKDHLGNLRLAYRLGQTRTYSATLKQDSTTHQRETQQLNSLSMSGLVAQQVGTSTAHTGQYVAQLNAGGSVPQPLGPLTRLAVQKGDTLRVSAPGMCPQAEQPRLSVLAPRATSRRSGRQPGPKPGAQRVHGGCQDIWLQLLQRGGVGRGCPGCGNHGDSHRAPR